MQVSVHVGAVEQEWSSLVNVGECPCGCSGSHCYTLESLTVTLWSLSLLYSGVSHCYTLESLTVTLWSLTLESLTLESLNSGMGEVRLGK